MSLIIFDSTHEKYLKLIFSDHLFHKYILDKIAGDSFLLFKEINENEKVRLLIDFYFDVNLQ